MTSSFGTVEPCYATCTLDDATDATSNSTDGNSAATPAALPTSPLPAPQQPGRMAAWLAPNSHKRRILLGLCIYAICFVVFGLIAADRMRVHSNFNHFALQAEAWLHGKHDVVHGGPGYAQGNDFAEFGGKTYISFPPFPAVLMLPLVALAGEAENFLDAQFIVWLAGVGPAVLFLLLEKLRRTGRSVRSETENFAAALVFAFGTVYFFTAVQGTVWFAGHVVGVGVLSLFLLCALDAERPALAGLLIGLAFLTRPTMATIGIFFVFEVLRTSARSDNSLQRRTTVNLEPYLAHATRCRHQGYCAQACPICVSRGRLYRICQLPQPRALWQLEPNGVWP
jgi:hypothetical protein